MYTMGQAYKKREGITGEYDIIVIGSGMGGLGAASVLAQQGKRVLVLEQHNVVGGLTQSYDRKGYRWSVGMHYVGDVGTRATLTWKMFDYATQGGLTWAHLPSIYNRMVVAGKTYRIPAGLEPYREALAGWFPDEVEAINQYLEYVVKAAKSSGPFFAMKAFPIGFNEPGLQQASQPFHEFASKTTAEVIDSLTNNQELKAVLCANWGDYGLEPSRSSFAMHAMLKKHYLNGASYPHGGGRAFADAMVPIIERAGGKVYYGAEVETILVEGGTATGVRLKSGESVLAEKIVSNAGLRNTYGRLMSEADRSAFDIDRKRESVTYTGAFVGLHIGLEGSAETLGFEPSNIWAHPGPDFDANLKAHKEDFAAPFPYHFVTFASAKDPTWDENFPNKSTIELYAFTDYRHFEQFAGTRWMKRGEEYDRLKQSIEERLLKDLYRLVPQAEGAVRYVEASTPLTYETFIKKQFGDFLGVESSPQRYQQDWLRATTPVPNLFLSGQDVTSDGMIGALFGGVICASAILGKDMLSEIKNTPDFSVD